MTPERETEYLKLQADQTLANADPSVSTSASEHGNDSSPAHSLTFREKLRRHRCRILIFAATASLAVFVLIVLLSGIYSPSDKVDLNTIESLPADGQASPQSKLQSRIQAMCTVTNFRDRCIHTLTAADVPPGSPTDTSFSLVAASVQAAAVAAQTAANYSAGLDLPPQHRDCRDLLLLADSQLRAASAGIGAAARDGIGDRTVPDLLDAVSAALSFEVTCSDGLSRTAADAATNRTANAVEKAMVDTRVGLAIVDSINSEVLDLLPEKKKATGHGGAMAEFVPPAEGAKPDAVVAKDGSGDFRTISEALGGAAAEGRRGRFVIYVKAGVYDEVVHVTAGMAQVTMYGDGPAKTIVTGKRSFGNGTSFYGSATFAVTGNGFMARGMRFENRAEAEMAVALRVESDLAVFYDCHVAGYHSVLYAHAHRQFYRDCVITGAADVITGAAAAMLQNCRVGLRGTGAATADLRVDERQNSGIVLQNCTVVGEKGLPAGVAVLGRVAKSCSRVVVMESMLGEVVAGGAWETGFEPDEEMESRFYLGEYNNRGPGNERKQERAEDYALPAGEAANYTAGTFIGGNSWLKDAGGIPFYTGFAGDAP